MTRISLSILTTALMLSGCNSANLKQTGITTPSLSGEIREVEDDGQQYGRVVENSLGDGYAFEVGLNAEGEGFAAYAGILPQTDLDAAPSAGTATMTGYYRAGAIRNIDVSDSYISGTTWSYSGAMQVNADFGSGQIDGSSNDGRLQLDGTIANDGSFAGNSTFLNVDGELAGVVDSDDAIGAFAGGNDDTMFAGGFIASN